MIARIEVAEKDWRHQQELLEEKTVQLSCGTVLFAIKDIIMENNEKIMESVTDIASELFRFKRVFEKAIRKADLEERNKYMSQFGWFQKKVDKALENLDLKIVNVEKQPYDPGMAVTPLNLDDFSNEESLIVIQMVEPIIMKDEKLIKAGTVILGRAE